jgi:hypothetical protein
MRKVVYIYHSMFNKNYTITNEELQMSTTDRKFASILLGVAVGDALGVPVEFMSRSMLQRRPITDMTGERRQVH